MPNRLSNRVLHKTQVPNEYVAEKLVIGALCVVTLPAGTNLRHGIRYAVRDAIKQAAWNDMIYCLHVMPTAIGTLPRLSHPLALAHSIAALELLAAVVVFVLPEGVCAVHFMGTRPN
jgi:hypothetical protein